MPSSRTTRRSPGASDRTRRPLKDQPASAGVRCTGSPSAAALPAGRKRSVPTDASASSVRVVRRAGVVGAIVIGAVAVVVAVAAATSGIGSPVHGRHAGRPPGGGLGGMAAVRRRGPRVRGPVGRPHGRRRVGAAGPGPLRTRPRTWCSSGRRGPPRTSRRRSSTSSRTTPSADARRAPRSSADSRQRPASRPGPRGGAARRWDAIPSERFAEAVMTYVLGHPPSHVLVHLHPGELRAVAAWAHGG